MPFAWNSSTAKNYLRSKEIKANAQVSFTRTLLVH